MAKTNFKPVPDLTQDQIRNILEKVDKTPGLGPKGECWEWRGMLIRKGYGGWYDPATRRTHKAHRVLYRIQFGPFDYDLCVLHHCDNPPCVRGSHLFTGTKADNNADMVKKGRNVSGMTLHPERAVRGSAASHTTLNEQIVAEIRDYCSKNPRSQSVMAGKFHVKKSVIAKIVAGTTWRHVPNPSSMDSQSRMAKLSDSEVDIVRQSSDGASILAKRFGVSRYTIWAIRAGRPKYVSSRT